MRSKLPTYLQALSKEERETLLAEVLAYTAEITRTPAEARLLAMETFEAVATTRPYDPDGKMTLPQYMMWVAKSLRSNERQAAATRKKHEREATRDAVALSGRSAPSPGWASSPARASSGAASAS